jgi:pimeloyl-ACP methyl ester carboxylesterase
VSTLTSQDMLAYEQHGAGVPVVLLPGHTFERRIWRPIVDRLGDDVHTIAIDLPGEGQSAGPPRPLVEVAAQVNDVIERLGVERPIVVGHSMAGAIAMIYASRYPVRGVVDIDSPLDVRPFAALIKQLEPALRGPSFEAAFAPFQDSMGLDLLPEPLRSLALDAQYVSRDIALGYFEELMRSDPDELQAWIEEVAQAIAVPSLFLFGQRLSREERDYTLAHVPHAQIEEWDGRGHFVHLAEPDRFAARLRAFIDHASGLPVPADLKTVEIEGARLAFREQGSGEAVVFVHGSISDLTIWEPQLAPVGERYRAIAYSRRYAWPNQDLPSGAKDTMQPHVDDLLAFLRAIDGRPAHLVGNSWGAFICLRAAMQEPSAVRSLVLEEPPMVPLIIGSPPAPSQILSSLLRHPLLTFDVLRFGAGTLAAVGRLIKAGDVEGSIMRFARGVLGEQALTQLPEEIRSHMLANASTHLGQFLADGGFEAITQPEIKSINTPALVITGAHSPVVLRRQAELLAALLPNSQRLEVPSASHFMHLENPGAVNANLLRFFAQVKGQEGSTEER